MISSVLRSRAVESWRSSYGQSRGIAGRECTVGSTLLCELRRGVSGLTYTAANAARMSMIKGKAFSTPLATVGWHAYLS